MQFGRMMGGALVVLGILLIVLQLGFSLATKKEIPSRRETPAKPAPRSFPLSGVLGSVLVVGGAIIFVKAQCKGEPDAKHGIK